MPGPRRVTVVAGILATVAVLVLVGCGSVAASNSPGDDGSARPDLASLQSAALTDLSSLTNESGYVTAGPSGPWAYDWPRDAAFVAAADAVAGRLDDAHQVLEFWARHAPASGRWPARVTADGAVPDARPAQSDGAAWVLWSIWFTVAVDDTDKDGGGDALANRMWPTVRAAAGSVLAEQTPSGLPRASPDYWEKKQATLSLGTVAPMLVGLRAATDLAVRRGDDADADRWAAAAAAMQRGLDRSFRPYGFPRTLGGGADGIVTVLGPPFAAADDAVTGAIVRARQSTRVRNGGNRPGTDWHDQSTAWTPSTALYGLSAAARGDTAGATAVLDWLARHRTPSGTLPEKVLAGGTPASAAPLAWTDALVVLAVAGLRSPLPVPPARSG